MSGHNANYSNLYQSDADNKNNISFEDIIPQKPKFGITGYKHARQSWMDRPQREIIDWKNVKIPAIGKGKRTCFDDVIEISKKKLSP